MDRSAILTYGTPPIDQKACKYSYPQRNEIEKLVNELCATDVQPSIVVKPCITGQNKMGISMFPLPVICKSLDELKGCQDTPRLYDGACLSKKSV